MVERENESTWRRLCDALGSASVVRGCDALEVDHQSANSKLTLRRSKCREVRIVDARLCDDACRRAMSMPICLDEEFFGADNEKKALVR